MVARNSARMEKDSSVTFDDSGGRKTLIDALKVSTAAFVVLLLLSIMPETLWIGRYLLIFNKLLLLLALMESSSEKTNVQKFGGKTYWESFCFLIKELAIVQTQCANLFIDNQRRILECTPENMAQAPKNDRTGDDQCPSPPGKKLPHVESSLMSDDLDGARESTQGSTSTITSFGAEFGAGDFGGLIHFLNTSETQGCITAAGYFVSGHYEATIIITYGLVFTDKKETRSGKTNPKLYENISVCCEYEKPEELHSKRREPTPETFRKVPSAVRLRPNGLVFSEGHPSGLDKHFEVCTIVPKENRNEFANYHIKARPISLSKTLYPLYDLIGSLECGSVQATCFLISSDIIATNWHVVDKILKARRSSTHVNHNNVFVYFHYEKFGEKSFRCQLMPLKSKENIMSEQFDYAFLHLQQPHLCSRLNELGERVRCKVPDFGNTCIVAHPNGEEKQEELVPILPLHENRRSLELERRLAEKKQKCIENPSECTLTPNGSECIHMYNSKLLELYKNEYVMTYDVGSMFEGSSGAPVFDMNGYIVALHTRGFRLEDSSVVEVGMTFKTIINDLQARNLHDFVQTNFPSCWEENMDED